MIANFTVLISAGCISDDDGKFLMIQGLEIRAARAIADWLAVATDGPVWLKHTNLMEGSEQIICSSPDSVNWATAGDQTK